MLLAHAAQEAERVFEKLEGLEPGTTEYDNVLEHLKTVVMIEREYRKDAPKSWLQRFLDSGHLVNSATTLAVAGGVLYKERFDIITSRAFGFIKTKS